MRQEYLVKLKRARPGFTRVEVVVVIAVLAMSIVFIVPAMQRTRDNGLHTMVRMNLKQLGLAAHTYQAIHKRLPPAYGTIPGFHGAEGAGSPAYGSVLAILANQYEGNAAVLIQPADYSWLEQSQGAFPTPTRPATKGPVYSGIAANYWIFGTLNDRFSKATKVPREFIGAPAGDGPGLEFTPLTIEEISDGSSNTLLFVTTLAAPIPTKDGFPVSTVAFDPDDKVASTSSRAHPASPSGPFFWRPSFDLAPNLKTYNTANSSGSTECAGCAPGQHAVAYSSTGIFVGLADGSARMIQPTRIETIGTGTNGWRNSGATPNFVNATYPHDTKVPEWDY